MDGGEEIYRQFAREEAADRRRGLAALAAAALVHVLLLASPLPWGGDPAPVILPPAAAGAFRLQEMRFAPPRPSAVPPQPPEAPSAVEPADPGPPPAATAELLVPRGPGGGLVPPQPVVAPPPPYPSELWRRGIGGEVVLTLVVDAQGEVGEVTVEEVRLEPAAAEPNEADSATSGAIPGDGRPEPGGDGAAFAEAVGRAAAEAVRGWLFLPATLSGSPITTAVTVRIGYPPGPAAAGPPPPAGPPSPP